jgi:hypothetical protein
MDILKSALHFVACGKVYLLDFQLERSGHEAFEQVEKRQTDGVF